MQIWLFNVGLRFKHFGILNCSTLKTHRFDQHKFKVKVSKLSSHKLCVTVQKRSRHRSMSTNSIDVRTNVHTIDREGFYNVKAKVQSRTFSIWVAFMFGVLIITFLRYNHYSYTHYSSVLLLLCHVFMR